MVKSITFILLSGLVVGGFYYFDRGDSSNETWLENERYRMDLEAQIEVASMRLERLEREGENGKLGAAIENLENSVAKFDSRMKEFTTLSREVVKLEEQFLAFREKRSEELRSRAVGFKWPEFVSASGRSLKDVEVITVDDSGVMLRHKDGSARLRYGDLTEEQRCFFGLEEESAIAAMKEELRRAQAYEQWLREEEEYAKINSIVKKEDTKMAKYSSTLKKPFPKAKRFVAEPYPEEVSPIESSLKVTSLSEPPRKVNQNPRFRVRGTPRYIYYNSVPVNE
jgi:uncharacterized protein YqgQ